MSNTGNKNFSNYLDRPVDRVWAGGDTSTGAASAPAGDPALIGTRSLLSTNGVAVPAGLVSLILTASTHGLVSPDCSETWTYVVNVPGQALTSTVSTAAGADCDAPGSSWVGAYALNEPNLVLIEQSAGETTICTRIM